MDCVPLCVTHPHKFFALFTLCPQEASLQGLCHAGSSLTWVPSVEGTGKRVACRNGELLGASSCSVPHFLIFWEWLHPSKISAPISNPSSMVQGLTSLRKLHFLPFAFSSKHGNNFLLLLASGYPNLPFWCSHCLNSPFIKVSWKIWISSISCWGSDW